MFKLHNYHPSEIKSRLRCWLMSYGYVAPLANHLHAIATTKSRLEHAITHDDEAIRLPARSLAQFLCQSKLRPLSSLLLTEGIAAVILLPSLLLWLGRGITIVPTQREKVRGVRWNKDPFRFKRNPNIFHTPDELLADAPETRFAETTYMRWPDLCFMAGVAGQIVRRSPLFSLQLIFKISKEIAWARYYIEHHPSEYVLLDTEFDCATSALTLYLHRHGQRLYNVMHGDKFRSAMDCFFEVDRCYCWNEFYVNLFKEQHARADFRIYANPNFVRKEIVAAGNGIGVILPVAMFIGGEKELRAFCQGINTLSGRYPIEIRPHPAYAYEQETLKPHLSDNVVFSDPSCETARQFIGRHQLIVGTTSTAITESIMLGVQTACVRCPYVNDIATYHFMFTLPNCHLVSSDALASQIIEILAPKVGLRE